MMVSELTAEITGSESLLEENTIVNAANASM